MAKLTDIVTKFDVASRTVAAIKTFVFDEMSGMDHQKEADYKLMLFKPPQGQNAKNDLSEKDWKLDYFIFDIYKVAEDDPRLLQKVWEECEDAGRAVLKKVLEDRLYGMVNPATEPLITYGYPMGNDRLVGTRFQLTIRAWYEC